MVATDVACLRIIPLGRAFSVVCAKLDSDRIQIGKADVHRLEKLHCAYIYVHDGRKGATRLAT